MKIFVAVVVVLLVVAVLVAASRRGRRSLQVESQSGSGQAPAAGDPVIGAGARDVGPASHLTPGVGQVPDEPYQPTEPLGTPAADPRTDPAAGEQEASDAAGAGQDGPVGSDHRRPPQA